MHCMPLEVQVEILISTVEISISAHEPAWCGQLASSAREISPPGGHTWLRCGYKSSLARFYLDLRPPACAATGREATRHAVAVSGVGQMSELLPLCGGGGLG